MSTNQSNAFHIKSGRLLRKKNKPLLKFKLIKHIAKLPYPEAHNLLKCRVHSLSLWKSKKPQTKICKH